MILWLVSSQNGDKKHTNYSWEDRNLNSIKVLPSDDSAKWDKAQNEKLVQFHTLGSVLSMLKVTPLPLKNCTLDLLLNMPLFLLKDVFQIYSVLRFKGESLPCPNKNTTVLTHKRQTFQKYPNDKKFLQSDKARN